MNKYQLPKDEIDVSNPFIKDTFFEIAKNSEVGSGNDKVDLESDGFIIYHMLSGKYNLKNSLDYFLVDHDKMKVINAIQMYSLGSNYEKLFELIKENKYCYLFLETVLKDNPFTKDIIDYLLNIYDKDTYQPIVDCNNETPLIWICENEMNDVALKLIDKFGEKCKPDHLNKKDDTALSWACESRMNDVALLLIDTFGELCKPGQVNNDWETSLICACQNKMNDVALKLIDKFGEKCKPEHVNNGDTAFILARKNKMNDVCSKMIEKFGKKIDPYYISCVCTIS